MVDDPISTKIEKVILALCQGASRREAFGIAGIGDGTFYRLAQDPKFQARLLSAEAQAEALHRNPTLKAVTGDDLALAVKAGQWWLERRRRQDYGPQLNLSAMPLEQLRELAGSSSDAYELPDLLELEAAASTDPSAEEDTPSP